MKKPTSLLLDAGPIIKLFELSIWDKFIERCDVGISRTVAEDEVVFAGKEYFKEYIDFGLKAWEEKGLIKIIEAEPSDVKVFYEKHSLKGKYRIDPGEEETLAFLHKCSKDWKLCSADGPVFSVLGFLGRTEQGISLEEILEKIGLSQSNLEWRYTKKFREKYNLLGQRDFVQDQNLL
jgi:hypothetical protein